MPTRDLTPDQVTQLIDTRDPATGLLYPAAGLQPYHDWLIQTLHRLAKHSAADFCVSPSDSAATDIAIAPGRASIAGTTVSYSGGTLALGVYNNDTALIWLEENAGAGVIDVADSAAGWPAGVHIKLAEVTLAGGAITDVIDRRFETMLRV